MCYTRIPTFGVNRAVQSGCGQRIAVMRLNHNIIKPPTLKKLMGHIAFGACVRGWVGACLRGCVTLFVPTVTFKPLKLES